MHDITCFDGSGNILRHFNQWELNNKIYIQDNEWGIAPMFHFENHYIKRAIAVQSVMGDDYSLSVDVPNELLLNYSPISVYVYATHGDASKSVAHIQIPVYKKDKPDGFVYEENVDYLDIDDVLQSLKELQAMIDTLNFKAKDISYDNTISKLESTMIQGAIDEIDESTVFVD